MNKMPKKVINNYVFYKIVCLDNSVEFCYVGYTADFNKRRYSHKNACINENNKDYNSKIYKTIRENGGWDNFKLIQIGTREQLTKREAEQIEENYRQELKANMNCRRCYLTEEQKQNYYNENKEYHQKYYEDNKNKILKYYQDHYEANKDKFLEYSQKYYEENKDKFLEYSQKYYEENKDKIIEKQKVKVNCECGCMISKTNLSTHKKSPKHIKLMEIKTENKN
jgi:hypothetical protein